MASVYAEQAENLAMAMAVYMLGFNTYMSFGNRMERQLGSENDGMLKRIYVYAKKIVK